MPGKMHGICFYYSCCQNTDASHLGFKIASMISEWKTLDRLARPYRSWRRGPTMLPTSLTHVFQFKQKSDTYVHTSIHTLKWNTWSADTSVSSPASEKNGTLGKSRSNHAFWAATVKNTACTQARRVRAEQNMRQISCWYSCLLLWGNYKVAMTL
jgi:hypothetical protein